MNTRPQYPSLDFVTQVGRLVGGSLHIASDKDFHGKPREKPQYWFALAIPKVDPSNGQPNQGIYQLLGQIQQHAFDTYRGQQQGQAILAKIQAGPIGSVAPAGFRAPFAWKVEDGDEPGNAGKAGYAGCWILKYAGTFPPNVCDARNAQLNPATVPTGSYVQVSSSVEINGKFDDTCGIYMNYKFVRVVAIADGVTIPIIQTGISAAAAFGDTGYTGPLPAGVPQNPPAAGYAGAPQGYQQPTQPGGYATPASPPIAPNAYGTPAPQAAPAGMTAPAGVQMPPPPAGAPAYAPPAATPAYAPQAAPAGNPTGVYTPGPAPAPAVPAGAVPAPGYPTAQPTQAAPGYPTAYPSSAPAPQPGTGQYPGVQPHQAFVHGVQPPR